MSHIPLWTRFLLWFEPTYFTIDHGGWDYGCVIYYQKLNGVTYVVGERYF